MKISDLLQMTTIILAVIAILKEDDRDFLVLKFTSLELIFLVLIFFFLNYLVFFEWWRGHFKFLNMFVILGYPSSPTWAYMMSICTVSWIVYKVFHGKFPEASKDSLILHYSQLIQDQDYTRLLKRIKKFHFKRVSQLKSEPTDKIDRFIIERVFSSDIFLERTSSINFSILSTYPFESQSQYRTEVFSTKFLIGQVKAESSFLFDLLSLSNSIEENHHVTPDQQPLLIKLVINSNFSKVIQELKDRRSIMNVRLHDFYKLVLFVSKKTQGQFNISIMDSVFLSDFLNQGKADDIDDHLKKRNQLLSELGDSQYFQNILKSHVALLLVLVENSDSTVDKFYYEFLEVVNSLCSKTQSSMRIKKLPKLLEDVNYSSVREKLYDIDKKLDFERDREYNELILKIANT